MEDITLLSPANAAVLLTWRGRKLLIDGLYHFDETPFSNLTAESAQRLWAGLPPYDDIDYLLFTHGHPDHFSASLTADYLERHRVRGVLLPPLHEAEQARLRAVSAVRDIPCVTLPAGSRVTLRPEADLCVEAIPTRHLDPLYRDVPHFVLLVTLGGDRLLFTGDMDYTCETLAGLPPLRAAFVNPLFFGALANRRFFRGELQTDTLVVHHVPFAADDCFQMRRQLERDAARWAGGAELILLTEPEQRAAL